MDGQWGAKRLTGTLGTGSGALRATTVSGAIALLRRPEPDPFDDPYDDADDDPYGDEPHGGAGGAHSLRKDI